MTESVQRAKKRRALLLWGLASAFLMVLITSFSGQDAADSSGLSEAVLNWLLRLFGAADTPYREFLHSLLRKAAHFTLYACLGVSLFGVTKQQERFSPLIAALILCALFAAGDEFHQSFVPGRGPAAADVLLDTCGAAAGCLVHRTLRKAPAERGEKKNDP